MGVELNASLKKLSYVKRNEILLGNNNIWKIHRFSCDYSALNFYAYIFNLHATFLSLIYSLKFHLV